MGELARVPPHHPEEMTAHSGGHLDRILSGRVNLRTRVSGKSSSSSSSSYMYLLVQREGRVNFTDDTHSIKTWKCGGHMCVFTHPSEDNNRKEQSARDALNLTVQRIVLLCLPFSAPIERLVTSRTTIQPKK